MVFVIYAAVLLAASFAVGIFGFFVGRCSRRLPIIDDNMPWAMHRGQGRAPGRDAGPQVRIP